MVLLPGHSTIILDHHSDCKAEKGGEFFEGVQI